MCLSGQVNVPKLANVKTTSRKLSERFLREAYPDITEAQQSRSAAPSSKKLSFDVPAIRLSPRKVMRFDCVDDMMAVMMVM